MTETFQAFVIAEHNGQHRGGFQTLSLERLPDYDVLVQVAYSTVNYKDGLAATGKGKIARRVPMVGGVDLSGTVVESRSPEWSPGDLVLVNGFGLSEAEWGGYGRYARMKAEWLTRLPDGLSQEEAMGIGTAGYTAALAVDALARWGALQPGAEILVTGAAGGVGSFSVALLAAEGVKVTASTGRAETHSYLQGLGATGFIDRAALATPGAPLQKERWAGVIDNVGGVTLANAIAQVKRGGAVASVGLAGSADLPGSVFPFILRGVGLLGIDSVFAGQGARQAAYQRIVRDLPKALLHTLYTVEPFSALPELTAAIVEGQIQGRVVVKIAE